MEQQRELRRLLLQQLESLQQAGVLDLPSRARSWSGPSAATALEPAIPAEPPPADTGEIISPGWASFEMATPSNGARITVSVTSF